MTDFRDIRALFLDIDGVMTDGSLPAFDTGEIPRIFNAKDTFGIRVACYKGLCVGVISGGSGKALHMRMQSFGVKEDNIRTGSRGKMEVFNDLCQKNGVLPRQVAYIGDDIPDIPVLKAAGIGIVPADASENAKEAADIISELPGGHGCVRDIVETILRCQNSWTFNDEDYRKLF